jgi:hypothetical protein
MYWMNCVLWLVTGAQISLGDPNMPATLNGHDGTFRIDFEDGTKSMAWAQGQWTRWECDHFSGVAYFDALKKDMKRQRED